MERRSLAELLWQVGPVRLACPACHARPLHRLTGQTIWRDFDWSWLHTGFTTAARNDWLYRFPLFCLEHGFAETIFVIEPYKIWGDRQVPEVGQWRLRCGLPYQLLSVAGFAGSLPSWLLSPQQT